MEYCKKYGLFVYDYYLNGKRNIYCDNLGDYIQSLAAYQYIPKNCFPYLVDRESIQFYHGPKIKLIMNGFFTLNGGGNNIASEQIIPIYVSYHINNKRKIDYNTINYLKKYEPIGCRDISTKNALINKGVDAYFSGCLTTTLDIDYLVDNSKRTNEIIFTDYKFGDLLIADNYLHSLKAYDFNNIINLTHHFNLSYGHLERFQMAKNLLDRYAKAKLVVTTRLHVALPCLGLRTPVIFINKDYDHERFPGLYELLNTLGKNSGGKFESRINLDDKGLVYNSDKYLEYANKLKEKLSTI